MPSARRSEGRVVSTRPSLCVLIALAVASAMAVFAAPALAEPKPLTLTTTSPPSSASAPANSTTPAIEGGEEGKTKSVVKSGARTAAITAVGEASNAVAIYTDPSCEGPPVKTGTLGELEGAGIQVEVLPDTATTFYATQTEAAHPSEPSVCSKGLTYYESSTIRPPEEEPPAGGGGGEPPAGGGVGTGGPTGNGATGVSPAAPVTPEAPRIHMAPGGPSNDNTPSVAGSAPGSERVKIFASDHCAGVPVAEVAAGQLPAGAAVQVPDNSETAFSALGVAGGARSKCSDPVTYVEDSTAPLTRVTMGPGAKTRRRKVIFRFTDITSNAPGTTFQCKLDHGNWRPCHSPFKVKHLSYRRHVLHIRGTDVAGNFEEKPVKRSFKVVRLS